MRHLKAIVSLVRKTVTLLPAAVPASLSSALRYLGLLSAPVSLRSQLCRLPFTFRSLQLAQGEPVDRGLATMSGGTGCLD